MIGPTQPWAIHLELPVGTGRFVRELRRRGRRHRIIGIDAAPGMLAVCRRETALNDRLELSFGDAFRLPLADASVDVVTSLRFFHLFPKRYWPRLLLEMQRVLRPGGILIAEMRNLFRGIGCGLYKEYRDRWRRGDHAHHFVLPHEIGRLFNDWERIELHGAGLDGLDRLALAAPGLAHEVHRIARVWPFRYLAKELLVKARKPVEQ
jgi:SAM-dependent methyltransferase